MLITYYHKLISSFLDTNKKDYPMKKISLIKVTGFVITAAFASNFVSAEEKVNKVIEKVQSEALQSEDKLNFSELIASLDTNKNGKLSEDEVAVKKNNILQEAFTKIDINQDKEIDEAEYNLYFADIKGSVINLANSES